MEKLFNYVYLTINRINGKGYIGSHGSKKKEDNYIGSGSYFKSAIKKYGKQNFIKIKLKDFDKILEARKAEEHYIKLFDTLSPNGYNMSITGGQGKWGGKLSEGYKHKISISMMGKHKGKIPWNKGMKMDEEFCKNTLRGINEKRTPNRRGKKYKPMTDEHKAAISKSNIGKTKHRKPMTDEHKAAISKSNIGKTKHRKPMTDEHKAAISKAKLLKNNKYIL